MTALTKLRSKLQHVLTFINFYLISTKKSKNLAHAPDQK